MLISLHLPKTAGTSFVKTLESVYGDALVLDYGDKPLNTGVYSRKFNARYKNTLNSLKTFNKDTCVHGHFLPYKYEKLLGKASFVTWLRDPIERLASHYYYWVKYADKHNGLGLHKRVVDEKWSLEKFVFSEEMKNTYSQFLWRFPIANFNFVGITEYYEEDLESFGELILKRRLEGFRENVNTSPHKLYIKDKGFRKELETFHSVDMGIYNAALKLREERMK